MTADLGFKIVYELFCVPDARILTCLMVYASAYKIYVMATYTRCVCITCYVSHAYLLYVVCLQVGQCPCPINVQGAPHCSKESVFSGFVPTALIRRVVSYLIFINVLQL